MDYLRKIFTQNMMNAAPLDEFICLCVIVGAIALVLGTGQVVFLLEEKWRGKK